MTRRRLPRSSRDRMLPPTGPLTVTWPRALRGRPPLLIVGLLGWLGGGLLATAVALVTESPNDLAYGLTNTALACTGLLLLALAPRSITWRTRRGAPARTLLLDEPVPVRVPAQVDPQHDDRREPALP